MITLFLSLQIVSLSFWYKDGIKGQIGLCLNFDVFFSNETAIKFLWFVLAFIGIIWAFLIYNWIIKTSKTEKDKIKTLTEEERKRLSHLAGKHEAKKGLQRMTFNEYGRNMDDNLDTFLNFIDYLFNPLKKFWNNKVVVDWLKLPDVFKKNTLKKWNIDEKITTRRGGIAFITKKNKIWVDAEKHHTLIVGTTDSGKTYSCINILIQNLRIAGESVFVNDVKGELWSTHGESFKQSGYKTYHIDFVHPRKSDAWSPLALIADKWQEADQKRREELRKPHNQVKIHAARELLDKARSLKNNRRIKDLLPDERAAYDEFIAEAKQIDNALPKGNYSEAQELVADYAKQTCFEPDAKDPFWPNSAADLLMGYIYLLLEQKGYGDELYLPREEISLNSINMVHILGKTKINPKTNMGCKTILELFLKKYRAKSSKSYSQLSSYVEAPDNTKGSIDSVFKTKISDFLIQDDVVKMTSINDIDLTKVGEEKTAIFITVHYEKNTLHPLVTTFADQLFVQLVKSARESKKEELKVPFNYVWDEFANGAAWEKIGNGLSVGRGIGLRFYLVVQDFSQIEKLYKDMAKEIRSQCMNTVFLLTQDKGTLEEISQLCGKKLVWSKNKLDKELVDVVSTDRLRKMSLGEALFLSQRKNPFISRLLAWNKYVFYNRLPKTIDKERDDYGDLKYFNIVSYANKAAAKEEASRFQKSTDRKETDQSNSKMDLTQNNKINYLESA